MTGPTDLVAESAHRAGTRYAGLERIWCGLLKSERPVDPTLSFFELGGTSLLASRLVARVATEFGLKLSLRSVFENPAFQDFYQHVDQALGPERHSGSESESMEGGASSDGESDAAAHGSLRLTRPRLLETPEGYPLSFAQRRLWFLDSVRPGAVDYQVPLVLAVRGQMDVTALRRAWTAVVGRHEILRTCYWLQDGEPVQGVMPLGDGPVFSHDDLSGGPEATRSQAVERLTARYVRTPMSLTDGDVARMHVISSSAWDRRLIVVFHHIAFDGWSETVFWRDLSAHYMAEVENRPAAVRPLARQYRDYALCERAFSAGETSLNSEAYWTRQLAGLAPLEPPADQPGPAVRSMAAGTVPFVLPAQLSRAIAAVAESSGTTRFVVLLSALQALIARYTRRTDVAVAVPVAGRTDPDCDDVIGLFVNTLILRAACPLNGSFDALVARNRETVLDALEHRDLPFEQLTKIIDPERTVAMSSPVQVMFGYEDGNSCDIVLPGLETTPIDVENIEAKFDLNLQVIADGAGETHGVLEYAAERFTPETAQRLVANLLCVLESATAAPGARLAELAYAPVEELRALVVGPNQLRLPRRPEPVHEVIAAQAGRTPTAIAVKADGEELTYGELERRSNQLARYLLAMGVGVEGVVAVNLPRGPELVVALLAVLKTGGAYVPLEPSTATERTAHVLADVGAQALITDRGHLGDKDPDRAVVLVDEDGDAVSECDGAPFSVEVPEDALAYVIYTSGTTGRPKGVMATHRGLTNYLWWAIENYATADGGTALFSSAAFDLVVPNLYVSLMLGRTLHVFPQDADASHLASFLLDSRPLSFVKLAPGHLELLVEELTPEQRGTLAGMVIAAGDRFSDSLASRWCARGLANRWPAAAKGALASEYGPTEITIGNSATFVEEPVGRDLVPLGRPIPNTTAYVLDDTLRPVGVGMIGEIYVGGVGVARGYVGQPGRTAATFLPDPFVFEPGARLYRTGDLAKVLPDGDFEFLGRIDDQVKIRGYRVEPAEVENILLEHAGVRSAVVAVARDGWGDAELAAYVVPVPDASDALPAGLKEFLKRRLPAYMIPAAITLIPEIPRTANGKVDRAGLAALGRDDRIHDAVAVAPSTEAEKTIAAVWRTVLGLADVGVHDSFFDLGGDSVRAIALVGAMRAGGFDVSVRDVFEFRTVARFAEVLGDSAGRSLDAARVGPFDLIGAADRSLLPADVVDAYPLSRIQFGMIVEMVTSGDKGFYHNVTSYLLRDGRPFRLDAFQAAVDLVVSRHEVLRTSMDLTTYSEPMQLVHAAGHLPVGHSDLRGLSPQAQEESLRSYMRAERENLFDLDGWPLFRFFVHVYDDHWRLTFTEFHPILEGWSLHLMLMELLGCYHRILDGDDPSPPDLPSVRYADFVALERRDTRDPAHAGYWRDVLAAHPPVTIPAAWGGEPGAMEQRYIEFAHLDEGLRALARRVDVPLKSVMHAAHLTVMGMLRGGAPFSSGLMCDTRPEIAGAERVLGMYLNTLPFPLVPGAPTWVDLVKDVFATEISLWPHRRYPIGNIQRDSGGLRPADVCFGFLDFHSIDQTLIETASGLDDSPSEFRLSVMAQQNNVLSLDCWPQDISPDNLDRLGEVYLAVLTVMAKDPDSDVHEASLSIEGRAALDGLVKCAAADVRTTRGPDQDAASEPAAPRNPVEQRVHRVFEQILKTEPIGVHDDFFAIGGDSLLAVRLLTAIERQFGVLPPMAAFLERPTIASLAMAIADPAATEPRPLVRLSKRRGTPVFCVHPIGGSVSCYTDLARELTGDAFVYGIQAIGLDLGQQRYADLESMAASYVDAARAASNGPWRLVGWSLGAVIAHEMARQLEAAGEAVELLALLDPSPPRAAGASPLDVLDVMARFQENLGADAMADREAIAAAPETERRAVLFSRLRASGVIPEDADEDSLQRALDAFIGNWRAYEAHRAQPIRGGAHLFYSDGRSASDLVPHWSELCHGDLVATHLPGGHEAALSAPEVLDLLRAACRATAETDNER